LPLSRVRAAVRAVLVSAAVFPLAASEFVPAKMPMEVTFPRPDLETQAHARHRVLSNEIDNELPIGIRGGAWPFKYELIQAPAGTTLGELPTDPDYGFLNIPKESVPASGTVTITIHVHDCENVSPTVITWDPVADNSAFVYTDNSVPVSGTGTHDSPLKDFQDWFLDDENDTTFANKVAVWKTGSGAYVPRSDAGFSSNVRFNQGSKTPSFIAYPGHSPVWDCTNAKLLTDTPGGLDDLFVYGITFQNARQDVSNAHFWWVRGGIQRITFARCTLKDFGGGGTVGNDNTCPIFISNDDTQKYHVTIKENTWDNISTRIGGVQVSNGSLLDMYYTFNICFEGNIAKNCDTTYGWWFKGSTAFASFRRNYAVENMQGRILTIGYGAEAQEIPHDHEVCWNTLIGESDTGQDVVLWAMSPVNANLSYNSFEYRNSISGRVRYQFFTVTANDPQEDSELLETQDSIYISDNNPNQNNHLTASVINEVGPRLTDTLTGNSTTDATGKLVGLARDNNLYSIGPETRYG